MNNVTRLLVALFVMSILAIALFVSGWQILARASGGWGALPQILFGLGVLIGACALVSPSVSALFAEISGSLFASDQRFKKPLPQYSIAQGLRKKGQFEESISAYRQIHQTDSIYLYCIQTS